MSPRAIRFTGVLVVIGMAPLATFGVVGTLNELRLQASDATAEAEIEQRRDDQVIYTIVVDGERYSHSDVTGRTRLWTTLSEQGLEELAQQGGTLLVRYLPSDPWVNRPVHAGAMPLGDPLAAACLFGAAFAFGLWLVVVATRRMREAVEASDPRDF